MKNLKEKIIFLRSLLKDYFNLEIQNRLPASTEHEKQLIKRFRQEMAGTPLHKAGPSWQDFSRRLKLYARFFDPRNFLNWQLIFGTMFMKELPQAYLQEFMTDPQWQSKWLSVLVEDKWGSPSASSQLAGSSGNVLTHAFHLFRLQKQTGVDFSKLNLIVEFGGGYGSMCRLLRRLGFKGTYVLYDLPEFLCLQKFYLQGLGFEADYFKTGRPQPGNLLVSTQQDLKTILAASGLSSSLFIATWSISETPLSARKEMLDMVKEFDYFLFGFQGKFDQVDNQAYFKNLAAENQGVKWDKQELKEWSGYYLLGKKQDNY